MRRSWCLVLTACLLAMGTGVVAAQDAEAPTDARVIELEADAALRFTQDGEQIFDIPVVPGETIVFRIDNTAGFDHTFYIGTDEELAAPYGTTDVGILSWSSGVRELVWVVPRDLDGLKFGSTVPGHYPLMQGCFSEARLGRGGTVERVDEAEACALPEVRHEWRSGGRVEVPWAGIAFTFPDEWEVSVDPDPGPIDTSGAMDVLSAKHGDYGEGSSCFVFAYDEADLDWDAALAGSEAVIELGEARALRFDEVSPTGSSISYSSVFLIEHPRTLFSLVCESDEGLRDDWLSIAESFEILPADDGTVYATGLNGCTEGEYFWPEGYSCPLSAVDPSVGGLYVITPEPVAE